MARSRYSKSKVLDGFFYETWQNKALNQYSAPDLLSGVQHFTYVIQAGDRLDHLSARFFNDDEYMWLLALINGINFPLKIDPGTVIRVPNDIKDVLNKLF